MTIVNSIEIDNIRYIKNDIKEAIKKNIPIEDKLHMIICISNPCLYARRYILSREFKERMLKDFSDSVILYIVELAFDLPGEKPQEFYVTEKDNPRHLQLRTSSNPLWHKENLWNLGVKLLPPNWKAVCFSDADIEYDNLHFATDTLKILNGTRDVLQVYSHCLDLDLDLKPMNIFSSFSYQYANKQPYTGLGIHYHHPGYNISMTRKAYDTLGGIYQDSILGSGDHNFFLCMINKGIKSINEHSSEGYKKSITDYEKKCAQLRLGYTPGVIKHYFHGSKESRGYSSRWKILIKHQFCPRKHITTDKNGLLIPSDECPQELLDDIMSYFKSRNEDEHYIDHLNGRTSH